MAELRGCYSKQKHGYMYSISKRPMTRFVDVHRMWSRDNQGRNIGVLQPDIYLKTGSGGNLPRVVSDKTVPSCIGFKASYISHPSAW